VGRFGGIVKFIPIHRLTGIHGNQQFAGGRSIF
jgi:hypothetical protein